MRLLHEGKDSLGISLWQNLLSIIYDWESNNKPFKIHKGTPYFWLAENYLLLGDRDLAFFHLYNAIEEDLDLGRRVPDFDYPKSSPAHLTATMRENKNNQMYYIVKSLRNKIACYIDEFNNQYRKSTSTFFTLQEFDCKFLANEDLRDIVYFFVFNFLLLYDMQKDLKAIQLKNGFARLKILDIVFNFCLIVDEILKYANKRGRPGSMSTFEKSDYTIANGIIWLICDHHGWMEKNLLTRFWGKHGININKTEPDVIIPKLLEKKLYYNGNPLRAELCELLISYKLRNYAGHNIRQKSILSDRLEEIIKSILFAIFISVESLTMVDLPDPI